MTPHEFAVKMAKIKMELGNDEEFAHRKMDDLMAAQLRELGYGKGVEIFDEQVKWYA